VDGTDNECYIIKKEDDRETYSSYTKHTSKTDSKRGVRIRHTVSFNGFGNATPLYITVYGLSESELPSSTCSTGVHSIRLPGLCYGSTQDCSTETVGFLISKEQEHTIYNVKDGSRVLKLMMNMCGWDGRMVTDPD